MAAAGAHGLSMFIAGKGPGFTVGRKVRKLGNRAIDSAELVFRDFRVPADQRVGGADAAVENSLEAMRIFGGYSYSADFDVGRYYRDSPLMCIGEGTNEMQRIIIARQLVERNPE